MEWKSFTWAELVVLVAETIVMAVVIITLVLIVTVVDYCGSSGKWKSSGVGSFRSFVWHNRMPNLFYVIHSTKHTDNLLSLSLSHTHKQVTFISFHTKRCASKSSYYIKRAEIRQTFLSLSGLITITKAHTISNVFSLPEFDGQWLLKVCRNLEIRNYRVLIFVFTLTF